MASKINTNASTQKKVQQLTATIKDLETRLALVTKAEVDFGPHHQERKEMMESFLNSPAVFEVIKLRGRLALAFVIGGLAFLGMGATLLIHQMIGNQSVAVTTQGFGLSAAGNGAVLMLFSLVPFLLAYLTRPTVTVGRGSGGTGNFDLEDSTARPTGLLKSLKALLRGNRHTPAVGTNTIAHGIPVATVENNDEPTRSIGTTASPSLASVRIYINGVLSRVRYLLCGVWGDKGNGILDHNT